MDMIRTQSSGRFRSRVSKILGISAVLVLGLCGLTACEAPIEPEKSQPTTLPAANVPDNPPITMTITTVPTVPNTVTSVPTNTAEPYPPPLLASTKEAAWTAVAEFDNELSTQVALTHAPTDTPGEPPIYPTVTPEMGMVGGCAMTSSRGPQCYNAWRVVINGEIIEVRAGREGSDGDQSQGLITVNNWHTHAYDIYRTPQRVGEVKIVSVDGMQFTLAVVQSPWTTATPGMTFVFDLATRQWVNP
jgi:hypothetical protein